MPTELDERTVLKLPIKTVWAIIVGLVLLVGSAFGIRESLEDKIHESVQKQIQEERENLKHYITREEFYDWWQKESVKAEQRHTTIIAAIERLNERLGGTRR